MWFQEAILKCNVCLWEGMGWLLCTDDGAWEDNCVCPRCDHKTANLVLWIY